MYLVSSAIFMNTPFDCGPWSEHVYSMLWYSCFNCISACSFFLSSFLFSLCPSSAISFLLSSLYPTISSGMCMSCRPAQGVGPVWVTNMLYKHQSLAPLGSNLPTMWQCWAPTPSLWPGPLLVSSCLNGWMDAFSLNPMASQIRHCVF